MLILKGEGERKGQDIWKFESTLESDGVEMQALYYFLNFLITFKIMFLFF